MKKLLACFAVLFLFTGLRAQEAKTAAAEDTIYTTVETEASFPLGASAWRSYLIKNCRAETPADNYAPPGTYTVVVLFVVDRNGDLSDVKALTSHGYGMEEEAVRVITKGPRWEPAIKDGKPIKAYRKQSITFQVMGDFTLSTYTIPAGKPTPITITMYRADIKPEDIEVTMDSGTITHDTGYTYLIAADKPGRILLTVRNKAKKKKDMEHYGTIALSVK